MLSAAQRASFEERGLLHLPGLVDAGVVGALRERVLARFRGRRLVPEPCPPGFAVTPSLTASVVNAFGFEEIWGPSALRTFCLNHCSSSLDSALALGFGAPEGGEGGVASVSAMTSVRTGTSSRAGVPDGR